LDTETLCSKNYVPVCGCDGKTYDNACYATLSGANIASEGPCACNNNTECIDGWYCKSKVCGSKGQCEAKPTACLEKALKTVCGCDGTSYTSSCKAAFAGVSVDFAGPCKDTKP
jgi:hypothetical protein